MQNAKLVVEGAKASILAMTSPRSFAAARIRGLGSLRVSICSKMSFAATTNNEPPSCVICNHARIGIYTRSTRNIDNCKRKSGKLNCQQKTTHVRCKGMQQQSTIGLTSAGGLNYLSITHEWVSNSVTLPNKFRLLYEAAVSLVCSC
jgi:hypothetical protein